MLQLSTTVVLFGRSYYEGLGSRKETRGDPDNDKAFD